MMEIVVTRTAYISKYLLLYVYSHTPEYRAIFFVIATIDTSAVTLQPGSGYMILLVLKIILWSSGAVELDRSLSVLSVIKKMMFYFVDLGAQLFPLNF